MLDLIGWWLEESNRTTIVMFPTGDGTSFNIDALFFAWWIVLIVGLWPMQRKAGRNGIDAIVPIVNLYAILKLAGMRGWWLIAYLFPVTNVIAAILVARGLGRRFERDALFTIVFLFALQPIGFLILGFGSARFTPDSPPLAARDIRSRELA